MTEETQPTDKPKKKKIHLIKTNFKFCIDQVIISADCGLPSEQKQTLRPPEFIGEPYKSGKYLVVDLKDHADRLWSLVAPTKSRMKRKLKYFVSIPKETIEELLKNVLDYEIPVVGWQKHKKLVCVKCQVPARIDAANHDQYRCATCESSGPAGELFVVPKANPPKPTDDAAKSKPEGKKEKPKESKKPTESKPIEGMSLKDRMAARKAAKGT